MSKRTSTETTQWQQSLLAVGIFTTLNMTLRGLLTQSSLGDFAVGLALVFLGICAQLLVFRSTFYLGSLSRRARSSHRESVRIMGLSLIGNPRIDRWMSRLPPDFFVRAFVFLVLLGGAVALNSFLELELFYRAGVGAVFTAVAFLVCVTPKMLWLPLTFTILSLLSAALRGFTQTGLFSFVITALCCFQMLFFARLQSVGARRAEFSDHQHVGESSLTQGLGFVVPQALIVMVAVFLLIPEKKTDKPKPRANPSVTVGETLNKWMSQGIGALPPATGGAGSESGMGPRTSSDGKGWNAGTDGPGSARSGSSASESAKSSERLKRMMSQGGGSPELSEGGSDISKILPTSLPQSRADTVRLPQVEVGGDSSGAERTQPEPASKAGGQREKLGVGDLKVVADGSLTQQDKNQLAESNIKDLEADKRANNREGHAQDQSGAPGKPGLASSNGDQGSAGRRGDAGDGRLNGATGTAGQERAGGQKPASMAVAPSPAPSQKKAVATPAPKVIQKSKPKPEKDHRKWLLLFFVAVIVGALVILLMQRKKPKKSVSKAARPKSSAGSVLVNNVEAEFDFRNKLARLLERGWQGEDERRKLVVTLYHLVLEYFTKCGAPRDQHHTPDEYELVLRPSIGARARALSYVTTVFCRVLYGGQTPTGEVFTSYVRAVEETVMGRVLPQAPGEVRR